MDCDDTEVVNAETGDNSSEVSNNADNVDIKH